jgi:hypothetical protein
VLLYVDSGSSHSALPAATFARLGVETPGSHFATIENAAAEKRAWSGGLIPEMRLGELALREVVAVVNERTAILGADVLTASGWRIDPDRGSLVLVEIGIRASAAGEGRVVEVAMPEPLRPLFRRGCTGLALLDVNPVLSTVRPMTADVEARFVFAFRGAHLD